jgi:hypothetical protein
MIMLQAFQYSAFPQSLKLRHFLLFAIGLLTVLVLPILLGFMPAVEVSAMNQGIDPTNIAVSLTHQEPNFYQ